MACLLFTSYCGKLSCVSFLRWKITHQTIWAKLLETLFWYSRHNTIINRCVDNSFPVCLQDAKLDWKWEKLKTPWHQLSSWGRCRGKLQGWGEGQEADLERGVFQADKEAGSGRWWAAKTQDNSLQRHDRKMRFIIGHRWLLVTFFLICLQSVSVLLKTVSCWVCIYGMRLGYVWILTLARGIHSWSSSSSWSAWHWTMFTDHGDQLTKKGDGKCESRTSCLTAFSSTTWPKGDLPESQSDKTHLEKWSLCQIISIRLYVLRDKNFRACYKI